MRRALPAIALTAAGLTWLLEAQGAIDTHAALQAATPAPTTSGTTSRAPGPVAAGTPFGPEPVPSDTPTPTPTPSPTPSQTPQATTKPGPVVNTRWGPVQVAAVLQGNQLVDVQVLAYPNERFRSERINEIALPLLHQEAVNAHSANIDVISGATYTSVGYARSLQAALDAAGLTS